ncbi:MAG: serine/threonine protein kinase [Deltaproteobacteria bacterium]|nr:serine/threonine protein kinase [Deltaproteobacteria bacterium]MBN2672841.1 serine/threonine protein kinase [Deltaproteobacteria bacterium]
MTRSLQIGDTLEGKYVINRKIGEGGMGVVYQGQHRDLEMRVAIKVLLPFEGEDASMKDRFKVEAKSSASIKHPNVVEVYDYGITPDGRPFFVMEYLEGESLADLLDRRKILRQSRAVEILDQVLSGLARAHKKNIIHRDLKPENIFLSKNEDRQEVVKILDFGIAKIMNEGNATIVTGPQAKPKRSKATARFKTEMGVVMGTPGYMAPEALTGQSVVDHRVDLFAVGILLFEMLTGRPPFRGKDAHEIMVNTATKPVPHIRTINPHVTKEMEQLCLIALSKEPEQRFQDAAEFIEYLTAAAVGKLPKHARHCQTETGIPSLIPQVKVIEETPAPAPSGLGGTSEEMTLDLDLSDVADNQRFSSRSRDEVSYANRSLPRDNGWNNPSSGVSPAVGMPRWQPQSNTSANTYVGPARARRGGFSWSYVKLVLFLGVIGAAAYLVWTSALFTHRSTKTTAYKINSAIQTETPPPDESLPDKVTIWVDVEPGDAEVHWNGELIIERPMRVPAGTKPVKVEVTKSGFRRKLLVVIPDSEKTISAVLEEDSKKK